MGFFLSWLLKYRNPTFPGEVNTREKEREQREREEHIYGKAAIPTVTQKKTKQAPKAICSFNKNKNHIPLCSTVKNK